MRSDELQAKHRKSVNNSIFFVTTAVSQLILPQAVPNLLKKRDDEESLVILLAETFLSLSLIALITSQLYQRISNLRFSITFQSHVPLINTMNIVEYRITHPRLRIKRLRVKILVIYPSQH